MIGLFFANLWAKFSTYIMGIGAVLAVVLGIYAKGREDSRSDQIAAQNKQRVKDLATSKAIHEKVNSLPPADIDNDLDKFMRD